VRVGSLFSGYGGLDLAVGGDLAWYSEIEPAACKVMEAHYPGVPNLGDISQVDWAEVEPVDVITGGYPCQPFSNAGARKGTNDERHLWPHVRDALSAIRPRHAVLENVRGHLTLGFDVVLADLADLGWSARWGVVRAADAGAPHHRARLFIVANPDDERLQGRHIQSEGDGRSQPRGVASSDWLAVSAYPSRRQLAGTTQRWELPEPAQHGADVADANGPGSQAHHHGRPRRGDARRPQLVERGEQVATDPSSERHGGRERSAGLGRMGGEAEGSGWSASATWQEPGAGSVEDAADASLIGRYTQRAESERQQRQAESDGDSSARWGDYAPAINRWQHVIGRPAPSPTIQRAGRDRLNPVFVEWMMGLPEGWVTGHGLSASQELKMLGNGVVPQQARLALDLLGGVA